MIEATADLVDDTFNVDTRVLKVLFGQFPALLDIKAVLPTQAVVLVVQLLPLPVVQKCPG